MASTPRSHSAPVVPVRDPALDAYLKLNPHATMGEVKAFQFAQYKKENPDTRIVHEGGNLFSAPIQ